MSKTYRIVVTPEYISKGVSGDNCRCPIALAASDAGMSFPSVGNHTITPNIATIRDFGYMPPEALEFIRKYDGDLPVEPFEFEITI